jgi:hypothetical protein
VLAVSYNHASVEVLCEEAVALCILDVVHLAEAALIAHARDGDGNVQLSQLDKPAGMRA